MRQYRSNQGRNPDKEKKNYKLFKWSIIGLLITFIFILFNK